MPTEKKIIIIKIEVILKIRIILKESQGGNRKPKGKRPSKSIYGVSSLLHFLMTNIKTNELLHKGRVEIKKLLKK